MILVDPNVLVALTDRSDTYHIIICQAWLSNEARPLGFPATVLATACYLIDRFGGRDAEARFLDAVGDGPARRFRVMIWLKKISAGWPSWFVSIRILNGPVSFPPT